MFFSNPSVDAFFYPSRDKDYHLRTYKSVVMANKLIDWLIAQVSHWTALHAIHNDVNSLIFRPYVT